MKKKMETTRIFGSAPGCRLNMGVMGISGVDKV